MLNAKSNRIRGNCAVNFNNLVFKELASNTVPENILWRSEMISQQNGVREGLEPPYATCLFHHRCKLKQ